MATALDLTEFCFICGLLQVRRTQEIAEESISKDFIFSTTKQKRFPRTPKNIFFMLDYENLKNWNKTQERWKHP